MPGKFNPVILEVVNQVSFYVIGLDTTITKAVEAGQFQLNVYTPVILYSIFEQINSLRRAVRSFREKAIEGLEVNPLISKQLENVSDYNITPLVPHLGYDTTTRIVLEAKETNTSIKDIILREGLIPEADLDTILDIQNMATPGIIKEELIIEKSKTKVKK
jgi:aspartate ammonia-lyase